MKSSNSSTNLRTLKTKKTDTYPLFFLLLFLFVCLSGCRQEKPEAQAPSHVPQRVIATLPSITEVLFDIGVGSRIVGVSRYTKYPPEAEKIEKIGGLYDTNNEKILSLKPDLVLYSVENETLRKSLTVPSWTVDHRTLQGVIDSYTIIGALFGKDILAVAEVKQKELQEQLAAFAKQTQGKKNVKVLICIDRSRGTGTLQNLFVAGKGSFLTEAVKLAGGENVAEATGLPAPTFSAEGVIKLAPEVIVDLCVSTNAADLGDWQTLGEKVPAVKNHRIYSVTDDYATIPGPRIPLLVKKLQEIFYEKE